MCVRTRARVPARFRYIPPIYTIYTFYIIKPPFIRIIIVYIVYYSLFY